MAVMPIGVLCPVGSVDYQMRKRDGEKYDRKKLNDFKATLQGKVGIFKSMDTWHTGGDNKICLLQLVYTTEKGQPMRKQERNWRRAEAHQKQLAERSDEKVTVRKGRVRDEQRVWVATVTRVVTTSESVDAGENARTGDANG